MKLKPIEPGMKIHCKNDNELSALLKECEIKGYVWYGTGNKPTKPVLPIDNIICLYDDKYGLNITYTSNLSKANTEFSDLIIPELSVEELVPILTDICQTFLDEECSGCPLNGLEHVANGNDCPFTFKDYSKVAEICAQWKTDHEKKELDVMYKEVCEKLAEYQKLEERGLLLRLPISENTPMYFIEYCCGKNKENISGMCFRGFCEVCSEKSYYIREGKARQCSISEINKTVFLSEVEAQEALKRLEESR